MFEFLGLLYDLAKDLKEYLEWDEEDKFIDNQWLDKSGFKATAENSGITLRWSRPEKVQTRLLDGYEILYEIEKLKRKRRRLVLNDGSVLIGKRT